MATPCNRGRAGRDWNSNQSRCAQGKHRARGNEGFTVCACAADIDEARALSALEPDYVAVEPPELIGGDISVTTADPTIVSGTAAAVREISEQVGILCGAGVKNGADVAAAIELGTTGVLLASGVTKAENPSSVVEDLVSAL